MSGFALEYQGCGFVYSMSSARGLWAQRVKNIALFEMAQSFSVWNMYMENLTSVFKTENVKLRWYIWDEGVWGFWAHQNWLRTVGLREQRGETPVTQSWQSWGPRRHQPHTGRHCWDQCHWRKGLYLQKVCSSYAAGIWLKGWASDHGSFP